VVELTRLRVAFDGAANRDVCHFVERTSNDGCGFCTVIAAAAAAAALVLMQAKSLSCVTAWGETRNIRCLHIRRIYRFDLNPVLLSNAPCGLGSVVE